MKNRSLYCSTGIHPRLACWFFAAGLAALPFPVGAQTTATGTIEGRVINPRSGEYLENARVVVEGSPSLEAFTDSNGQYRLANVPAGPVRLRASFTGMNAPTEVVTAGVYPINFACPNLIVQRADGSRSGISDWVSPWSLAVAQ